MKRLRERRRGTALVENALLIGFTCALGIPAVWTLCVRTNAVVTNAIDANSHSPLLDGETVQNPFAGETPPAGGPNWHQGDAPVWP